MGAVSPGVSDVAAEGGETAWLQETCLLTSCWCWDGWKRDTENVPDLVPREWSCPSWRVTTPLFLQSSILYRWGLCLQGPLIQLGMVVEQPGQRQLTSLQISINFLSFILNTSYSLSCLQSNKLE